MIDPKKFYWFSLLLATITVGALVLITFVTDIYGLFQHRPKKNKVVYYDERMSKYLMALNYIPNNFDGVWMGPSLSANINTKEIKQLDIYNLSVMGANITEEKTLLETILEQENHLSHAIICLNPYFTENHGYKANKMSDKAYFSSFGSYGIFKEYMIYAIRKFDLLPNKYPKNQYNEYGYNNYDKLFKVEDVGRRVDREIAIHKDQPLAIDSIAIRDLQQLDNELTEKGVKVIYYFHPVPYRIYQSKYDEYQSYKDLILREINPNYVIDFNIEKYSWVTKNYDNYLDHGHLSKNGQRILIDYLREFL